MRAVLLVSALLVFAHPTWATIEFVRVPTGGLQPQAAVDARGALHLIYFKGEPTAGDVFYIRRDPATAAFTPPLRVNSQPNTVIAIGTVRGAHLALGKDGRPHIAWMGAGDATAGMHYARLDDAGQAVARLLGVEEALASHLCAGLESNRRLGQGSPPDRRGRAAAELLEEGDRRRGSAEFLTHGAGYGQPGPRVSHPVL